jgi:hypothetical protein
MSPTNVLIVFGVLGGAFAIFSILVKVFCLANLHIHTLSNHIDKAMNKNKTEEEKLRKALRWEKTKLFGFGFAEIFDVVSDWMSIYKMSKESLTATNTLSAYVKIYAFLGGSSLFIAIYALAQRAAIQHTVNESIHEQFVSSLREGKDIKEARGDHFTNKRTSIRRGSTSIKESVNRFRERSVRERSVKEKNSGTGGEDTVPELLVDGVPVNNINNNTNKSRKPSIADIEMGLAALANTLTSNPPPITTITTATTNISEGRLSNSDERSVSITPSNSTTPRNSLAMVASEVVDNNKESAQARELDKKSIALAKEYAYIERQMLLMQISVLLLFVEDLPSIVLNCIVYLPRGDIPLESILSCAISLLVIGHKISMFDKLKMMRKREEDIETVFKTMSDSQMKDTKLRIMEEMAMKSKKEMERDKMLRKREQAGRSESRSGGRGGPLRGNMSKISKGMKSFRIGGALSNPKIGSPNSNNFGETPSSSSPGNVFNKGRRMSRDFASKIMPVAAGGAGGGASNSSSPEASPGASGRGRVMNGMISLKKIVTQPSFMVSKGGESRSARSENGRGSKDKGELNSWRESEPAMRTRGFGGP